MLAGLLPVLVGGIHHVQHLRPVRARADDLAQRALDRGVLLRDHVTPHHDPVGLARGSEVLTGQSADDAQLRVELERHVAVADRDHVAGLRVLVEVAHEYLHRAFEIVGELVNERDDGAPREECAQQCSLQRPRARERSRHDAARPERQERHQRRQVTEEGRRSEEGQDAQVRDDGEPEEHAAAANARVDAEPRLLLPGGKAQGQERDDEEHQWEDVRGQQREERAERIRRVAAGEDHASVGVRIANARQPDSPRQAREPGDRRPQSPLPQPIPVEEEGVDGQGRDEGRHVDVVRLEEAEEGQRQHRPGTTTPVREP